jgi:Tfp pilus assembly protein PilF
MSTLLNVKNAKIPVFDGTKENFPVCSLRFQTFAKTYKFRQTLKETPEADMPRKEEEETSDKNEQKALARGATMRYTAKNRDLFNLGCNGNEHTSRY